MSHWMRCLICALIVGSAMAVGCAQAASDQQEAQAQQEYELGLAKMKVMSWEEAITQFNIVMKRYPNTQARYKAQFSMSDCLVAEKKEPDALNLLNTVVKEEDPEQSPEALNRIGLIYTNEQKYNEATQSFKHIIGDYPDNPMVDHAYSNLGDIAFKLGHYLQAVDYYSLVGTAYASRVPDLQRVSPGEPLIIRLQEPNMVAAADTTVQVTVTGSSGDKETVLLKPVAEGSDHFTAQIPTKLADAKAGDGILEIHGNDTVTLTYKNRYVSAEGAKDKSVSMAIASNGRLTIRNDKNEEVRGVVVGYTMAIEVYDPDQDKTDQPDTVKVDIRTKQKDTETVTLTETGAHTGLFRATIATEKGDPTPGDGKVQTNADMAENSGMQLNDYIIITYTDPVHLNPKQNGPMKVEQKIIFYAAAGGDVNTPPDTTTRSDQKIKKLLYEGRALNEVASTYRDLGQDAKSANTFRRAEEKFNTILHDYPQAPAAEDAMFGLFDTYVGQSQYESAISIIAQITRRFPQSVRAPQALLELADVHIKREEYDRALAIYQGIVQRAKGTPLAEEAAFKICDTYMMMYKPKSSDHGLQNTVSAEEVASAFMEFVQSYPQSERAPEALFQLATFRLSYEDFQGVISVARRMVNTYPDNVMTGRVLLSSANAQYKLRLYDDAKDTLRNIIANYGSEADAAEKLLQEIIKKTGGSKPAGATGAAG